MAAVLLGWVWLLVGGLLYAGQVVSTVNFPLAQRLGLQEDPDIVDPILGGLERKTAAWDVVSIWVPPVAGALMLFDHALWPAACLVAGGVYFDTGGREWAKISGLMAEDIPVGTPTGRAVLFVTYAFFVVTGLAGVGLGLAALIGGP